MIRRPPRSTQGVSSAASDVYKRQVYLYSSFLFAPHVSQLIVRWLYRPQLWWVAPLARPAWVWGLLAVLQFGATAWQKWSSQSASLVQYSYWAGGFPCGFFRMCGFISVCVWWGRWFSVWVFSDVRIYKCVCGGAGGFRCGFFPDVRIYKCVVGAGS